jgi:hypothetical protein
VHKQLLALIGMLEVALVATSSARSSNPPLRIVVRRPVSWRPADLVGMSAVPEAMAAHAVGGHSLGSALH